MDPCGPLAGRHIVVACCEEHHMHEKTVAEGRGRVVAACAGELEGVACVTAGGGSMKNNWNDAVVGTGGKLHSDRCDYFPDQVTVVDCHTTDDTGWVVVARMSSVDLLLQDSNGRVVVTLDGILVPGIGVYRTQSTVVLDVDTLDSTQSFEPPQLVLPVTRLALAGNAGNSRATSSAYQERNST